MIFSSYERFPAMFILYTFAPIIYRLASSPFYNLSLLSSDFFGLLFGECRTLHVAWLFDSTDFWIRFIPFREQHVLVLLVV